jgi:hypothetical protein
MDDEMIDDRLLNPQSIMQLKQEAMKETNQIGSLVDW